MGTQCYLYGHGKILNVFLKNTTQIFMSLCEAIFLRGSLDVKKSLIMIGWAENCPNFINAILKETVNFKINVIACNK